MKDLDIIKKELKQPCYKCDGTGKINGSNCDVCKGSGVYIENYYYHIVNGVCFASEFIK